MRILAVTDLHGRVDALVRILAREDGAGHDVLFLGGDLTDFGTPADAVEVIEAAGAGMGDRPVLAVAGNCDSRAIEHLIAERGISVHACGRRLGEVGVFGLSAMPPWRGDMYEFTEEELCNFLRAGWRDVEDCPRHVLLSHPPPRGACDQTRTGREVGSTAVRARVEAWRPELVVCGHVHEARGTAHIGPTLVVNCGKARAGHYAVIDLPEDGPPAAEHRRL